MKLVQLSMLSLAVLASSPFVIANDGFQTDLSPRAHTETQDQIGNESNNNKLSADLTQKLSSIKDGESVVVIISLVEGTSNSVKTVLDQYGISYQNLLAVPVPPSSTLVSASVTLTKRSILKLSDINEISFVNLPSIVKTSSTSKVNQSRRNNITKFTEYDGVHFNTKYTGKGVTVAVFDSGINPNHPQLKNNVITHYCFSDYFDQGKSNKTCPTNYHGQKNLDIHGTHVAGIIGAKPLQGGAPMGVAPNVELINIRVLHKGGNELDTVSALSKINSDPKLADIKIINMSMNTDNIKFHGECDNQLVTDTQKTIKGWIDYLTEVKKIHFTVSTGNDSLEGYHNFPACLKNVISVANNHHKDVTTTLGTVFNRNTLTNDSNISSSTTITAPGNNISSTNADFKKGDLSSYSVSLSGTSMAAPAVAGCIALMLEKKPDLTPSQTKEIITRSTYIQASRKNDHDYLVPVLDCKNSLLMTF